MVEKPAPEHDSRDTGPYVEELRSFLCSRGLAAGEPACVPLLAAKLGADENFREEAASLIRTIHYQEHEQLGRGEMLDLLLLAAGGPAVNEAADPAVQGAIRPLFQAVHRALRQSRFAAEPEEATDTELTAGALLAAAARGMPKPESYAGSGIAGEDPLGQAGPEFERFGDSGLPRVDPSTGMATDTGMDRARQVRATQVRATQVWSLQNRQAPGQASSAADPRLTSQGAASAREQPGSGDVLLRAMDRSARERDTPRGDVQAVRFAERARWAVPALVASIAVLLVGALLAHPLLQRTHPADVPAAPGVTAAALNSAPSCVAPLAAGATRAGVEERARWAHTLLDRKLYAAALPEVREVARMNPGYPGVKLDESQALLNLKRPDDAREAIDTQIGISECLSKLPAPLLSAYCGEQFAPAAVGGCKTQLAHIRQAAELQAALVHLELGHSSAMDDAAVATTNADLAAASAPVKVGRYVVHRTAHAPVAPPEPLPPATEGDADLPPMPREGADKPRTGKDANSLVRGEGTDSVYGAYQKPQ